MDLLKDSNGNIVVSIASILIISFLILSILFLTTLNYINNENIDFIAEDSLKYILNDYEKNLEIIAFESVEELSEKIVKTKKPSLDSQKDIKNILNKKLLKINEDYSEKYGININSNVSYVKNSDKPIYIELGILISIKKFDYQYNKIISNKISVEGLKDPLPFIVCGNDPSFSYNTTHILYHESLSNYLKNKNLEMSEGYLNAKAPLKIKLCPFDPYIHHGDEDILKNCLENCYYHESADGSCYLCRLEGKTICPHYGFETFIQPSSNITKSISSPDHVIFHDHYYGDIYYYFQDKMLFLDSSHKLKYGLK